MVKNSSTKEKETKLIKTDLYLKKKKRGKTHYFLKRIFWLTLTGPLQYKLFRFS